MKHIGNATTDAESSFGGVIAVVIMALYIVSVLSGCMGGRIYVGFERHDTLEQTINTKETSFLCGVMGYCGDKK